MRIVKLAAGLIAGYVLGARAGREKYEQIAAAARKVGGYTRAAQVESQVARPRPDADSATTPAAVPPIAPTPPPVVTSTKPRRKRNRPRKAVAPPAAMSTVNLDLDALPMESAEADVVEQHMPVLDPSDQADPAPTPLESDAADVREQRRSW